MEMATFFNGHRMIPGGKSDLEVAEMNYQKNRLIILKKKIQS